MIWSFPAPPPTSPPSRQESSSATHRKTEEERQLVDWLGGRELWEGANRRESPVLYIPFNTLCFICSMVNQFGEIFFPRVSFSTRLLWDPFPPLPNIFIQYTDKRDTIQHLGQVRTVFTLLSRNKMVLRNIAIQCLQHHCKWRAGENPI